MVPPISSSSSNTCQHRHTLTDVIKLLAFSIFQQLFRNERATLWCLFGLIQQFLCNIKKNIYSLFLSHYTALAYCMFNLLTSIMCSCGVDTDLISIMSCQVKLKENTLWRFKSQWKVKVRASSDPALGRISHWNRIFELGTVTRILCVVVCRLSCSSHTVWLKVTDWLMNGWHDYYYYLLKKGPCIVKTYMSPLHLPEFSFS